MIYKLKYYMSVPADKSPIPADTIVLTGAGTRNNPLVGSVEPNAINKNNTTITKVFGNSTNYVEQLNVPIVDPRNLTGEGGNSGDLNKKNFISKIYNTISETDKGTSIIDSAPWSLANRYTLFTFNGLNGVSKRIISEDYLNKPDNYIMGGKLAKNPITPNVIEYYKQRYPHLQYRWSDFMYSANHEYVPNNYMLTLRRFATPVEDNIFNKEKRIFSNKEDAAKANAMQTAIKNNGGKTTGLTDIKYKDPKTGAMKSVTEADMKKLDTELFNDIKPYMAQAVTWWGEGTNNSLSDILTMSYGFKWKSQTTETTTIESNNQGYTAQPFYESLAGKGLIGRIGESVIDMMKGNNQSNYYRKKNMEAYDPYETTYPNFVIGPVNVINEMQTRDQGLNFDQSIKLTFEYKLKQYDDINAKIALLDILANLMVLTFDNASFWGGANRFIASSGYVAARFGDDQMLRRGNFKGYLNSLVDDIGGGLKNAFADDKSAITNNSGSLKGGLQEFFSALTTGDFSGLLNFGKGLGGSFVGNILGKLINKNLGAAPAMQHVKGMITGEATGTWHLTVGNPMNPIATIGNLILESSSLSFNNELGYDDFPTEFKLEVSLKPARPRDKTEIESMFNAGKGRLYAATANEEDFLNIAGKDVKIYGAFQHSERNSSGKGVSSWWQNTPSKETGGEISTKAVEASISGYRQVTEMTARFIH